MLKSLQFATYLGMRAILFLVFTYFFDFRVIFTWRFIESSLTGVTIRIVIDRSACLILFTVLTISCSAFIYTSRYLSEKDISRFSWILILFVLSICLLVLFPFFPAVVLGWDGLGLTSFFLIAYYQNRKARSGSYLTGLRNRIGDCFILLTLGCWQSSGIVEGILVLIVILTKRAQFPYISWLPAAIAAPTPVSSLVHSSTLVTAGVYLVFRYGNSLSQNDLYFLGIIACFSLILSRLRALFETDIKKVIALSTLSQVSLILVSLRAGLDVLALVHLIAHAFAKALLFFCAGDAIHVYSTQDLRKVSSANLSSTTKLGVLLATFGIIAVPFFGGAYSKELIIRSVCYTGGRNLLYYTLLFSVLLTSAYMGRLLFTICLKEAKEFAFSHQPTSDYIRKSYLPIFIRLLIVVPRVGMTLLVDPLISLSTDFDGVLFLLGVCILGLYAGGSIQKILPTIPQWVYIFFSNLGFQNELSTHPFNISRKSYVIVNRALDQGWLEIPANNRFLKYIAWSNIVINAKWIPALICLTLAWSAYIILLY